MGFKKFVFIVFLSTPLLCTAAQTELEIELSKELTRAVKEINASTPIELDEETTLDSAATFKNYIIYNNSIINYTADELDAEQLNQVVKESVMDPLCTTATLQSFIEFGVIMVYRYHGKNGEYITELTKDMSTCK